MESNKHFKSLIFLLMFIFLISITSGLNAKKDELTVIRIPCTLDGAPCTSNALCNLTIRFQNGTYFTDNEILAHMGNGDFETNKTFSRNGDYPSKTFCTEAGQNKTTTFTIKVTGSGAEMETSDSIFYSVIFIISLGLFLLMLFGAIRIPWRHERNSEGEIIGMNDLKFVKILLWFSCYLMMIWLTFIIKNIAIGFLFLEGVSAFFNFLFILSISFFLPIFTVFIWVSVVLFLENKKIKEALTRGLTVT